MVVGGGVSDNQFPTFDAESKSAKILKSLYGDAVGGQWWPISNFLNAESKSAKITKSLCSGGGGEFGAAT